MAYNFCKIILKFLMFCLLLSKGYSIINNPEKIEDSSNVGDFILNFESDLVETTTNDIQLKIIKDEDKEIIYNGQKYYLGQNIFLCKDESSYYHFIANDIYYNKTPNIQNDTSIETLKSVKTLSFNVFGWIKEYKFINEESNSDEELANIPENDIVIYGKTNDVWNRQFFFSSFQIQRNINPEIGVPDIITCKFLKNAKYICAYILSNEIKISIIINGKHRISSINLNFSKQFEFNDGDSDIGNLVLFDTDKEFYKILCAYRFETNYSKCCVIYAKISWNSENKSYIIENDIIDLKEKYETILRINHKCYITEFNSELLFCCGEGNIISCYRRDKNTLYIIDQFSLNLTGSINNIFISSDYYHIIISYSNETSTDNYSYKYYIYRLISKYPFFYLNSFGTGNKQIPSNIIDIDTNTKYFIKFQNLPLEYGILKIDDYEINSTNEFIEITREMNLIFTSNNYNTTNQLKILYEIKIQETYSVTCTLTLTIKECYHSCKGCTVDNSYSNENEHNCKECKEGYFPDSTKPSNCYEPEPYECYSDCLTCNGSLYNNCLNCSEERVLYKGECITSCPLGTFKTNENGINICRGCYRNCEACNELGDSSNMKCLNCSNDKIKNDENCYRIKDYQIKTFYDPENTENILSCKTFEKYILENTSECILEPENGYFFINNQTGLISFCDDSCETCSNSPTAISANCDSCHSNTIYNLLQDGNCVSSCSEGYYLSDNKCLKCHKNCLTCDGGFIKNSAEKLINMKCTKCACNSSEIVSQQSQSALISPIMIKNEENCFPIIEASDEKIIFDISEIYPDIKNGSCLFFNKSIYPGQNECIEKPEKTFYVLNNADNTGVIKNCSEECDTCLGEKTSENTNCIKCAKGYYKKEESNTNCIPKNLIPVNHYLNTTDNVYYKCHPYCYNCTKGYDLILDNMNCISCNKNLINEKTSNTFLFKLLENGNCIQECPDNYYLTNQGDCVLTCPKGFFKFTKNFTCLENCPKNYEVDKEQSKCIIKSYNNISYSEFKTQILNNITELVNSSYAINGSDFIAVIITSDEKDPKEQLKYGISAIDLGNCTEELKEYHNIPKDENLIILNMESKRNESKNDEKNDNNNAVDVGKTNQIEVFDKSGRKLNLSVCKEDIKIMKYLGDIEEIDLQSANDFANRGIDVFNASEEFFNNLCHKYNNTDEKDIIIDDRRTDIYQNVSFCQKGCSYTGINYTLSSANCICDSNVIEKDLFNDYNITENNDKEESENKFKYIAKSFIANLMDFNINVIYCYNLIIDLQILKSNVGFYSMAALLFSQIVFLFIYIFQKLKSLKNFMVTFDINKNITKDNTINKDDKNEIKSNVASFPPPKTKKLKSNKEKQLIENNKKSEDINGIFEKNGKKIKSNLRRIKRQNVDSRIKGRKKNDKSNSSRKLKSIKDDIDNINDDNISKLNSKNDLLKLNNILNNNSNNESPINKEKTKEKNLTPFSPFINVQSPIININNTKQVKLSDNAENTMNINNQAKEIKLKQKNNNKAYSIKKKHKKRKIKNKILGKEDTNNIETIGERKNTKINKKDLKLLNNDEDIHDLDYEKAIIYDKRSYLRMYCSFLIDTQIILGTFCTDNYLNLFVIKLSFFIFTFQISFFLNALFYTDDYISDAYHNEGVLDFITGLPKSLYSFIATLITTNLLRMLSNSRSELKKLILEKRLNKNYIFLIDFKLRKLRKKLVIYFILVFCLGLFFLYYVSAFCAVYRYSQKYWFIGCLESFGMDSLSAVSICIVLAFLRYIAIKRRIKCLYFIANLISTFL